MLPTMEGTLRETAVLVLREQPKGHAQGKGAGLCARHEYMTV